MRFVEAFNSLGYQVEAPRSDWSAAKDDGVCITIWQKERFIADGMPYFDLWELHPLGGVWQSKPGHSKRTRHLSFSVDELNGDVDVIFVSGEPGESYETAHPWIKQDRGFGWKIVRFDPVSGFFRAEIDKSRPITKNK